MSAAPRLLLTRPAGRGEALAAELQASGVQVSVLPLLSIEVLSVAPLPPGYIPELIIAVSVPALDFGLPGLPAAFKQIPCYAVGAATAAHWRAAGYDHVFSPPTETSEGLLALPALLNVQGKPVLLLRGAGGRATLAENLSARGAVLTERVVYRRLPADAARCREIAVWAEGAVEDGADAVLLSSAEALENLCAIIAPAQRLRLHALCLGPRITALATGRFGRISTLSELSTGAILTAIMTAISCSSSR